MLDAGQQLVIEAGGLHPGLTHIGFEEVIRQAQVTRSSAYRIWSSKEDYYSELLLALAARFDRSNLGFEKELAAIAIGEIAARIASLTTEQGRHDLLLDICRKSGSAYYLRATTSIEWRNYTVLNSRLVAMDDATYEAIKQQSAPTNHEFDAKMASLIVQLMLALGLKLRSGVPSPDVVLQLAGSTVDGLVLRGLSVPDQVNLTVEGAFHGQSGSAVWTLPGLAFASTTLSLVEPDPEWDNGRIPMIRTMLGHAQP